jgi:hypothetical protein
MLTRSFAKADLKIGCYNYVEMPFVAERDGPRHARVAA